jgi:hypothetical protein
MGNSQLSIEIRSIRKLAKVCSVEEALMRNGVRHQTFPRARLGKISLVGNVLRSSTESLGIIEIAQKVAYSL